MCFVATVPAQQKRTTATKARTTQKSQARKPAAKKTTKKSGAKKTTTTKKTTTAKQPTVNGLKQEQQQVRNQIKVQEQRLKANERDVNKRLQNLLVINNEIADKRKTIDTIRHDIVRLDGDIQLLNDQLKMLKQELEERKQRYTKSLRYMHAHRNIQSKLMFVFSAKSFSQMYRRMRFVREYAGYQQTQGEAVMSMQEQVKDAYNELTAAKRQKNDLLYGTAEGGQLAEERTEDHSGHHRQTEEA